MFSCYNNNHLTESIGAEVQPLPELVHHGAGAAGALKAGLRVKQ